MSISRRGSHSLRELEWSGPFHHYAYSFYLHHDLLIFFPYKELISEALFPSTVFRIPHKFSRFHSTRPYQRTEKISLICFIFNLTILWNLILNPHSTMTVRLRIDLSFRAARITSLGRESVWKRYIWQAAWKLHWQITYTDDENNFPIYISEMPITSFLLLI